MPKIAIKIDFGRIQYNIIGGKFGKPVHERALIPELQENVIRK